MGAGLEKFPEMARRLEYCCGIGDAGAIETQRGGSLRQQRP
jgi:hypothetical protein